ncbi:eRF1 methyltransferase catalytic subunit MTQ2 [Elsinoe australis]|uniref:ERF1 methyltransferase catalytic subunit MTQ2 n=1 Tax=Elsinoe australis TaxID=40998 RepID=A0A4V6DUG9_9PEZI|nr:eRF1 methyltransferase catalytic subunit MTQ2 [Elsinoe australis]
MLPTPSTSHVPYDRVYEPAEDSYLLLDTLSSQSEAAFLKSHFLDSSSPLICEVGTGSGVVLAFTTSNASTIFGRSDVVSLGVDINHFACSATSETVRKALDESSSGQAVRPAFMGSINADLTTALKLSSVDILIFNPPYVPAPLPDNTLHRNNDESTLSSTGMFERDSHLLALSYAGGEEGMEVTNRLLDQVPGVLSRTGVAYVLLCAQNKPRAVMESIKAWEGGWDATIVGDSGGKAGWEKLVILRIWRPT